MRPISPQLREVMSSVCQVMPRAVISHASAAHLHELISDEPRQLHIAIPHGGARHYMDGIKLHQSLLLESLQHEGVPVMTLPRASLLTACSLPMPHDGAGLLYRAVYEHNVSAQDLLRHAALVPRDGRGLVTRTVRELVAGARSVPEGIMWTACWEVGLPIPILNQPMVFEGVTHLPDALFEDQKLIVEIDGQEYHSSDDQRQADGERQARIERAGFQVMRFPASHVLFRPDVVMTQLMQALGEERPLHSWWRRYESRYLQVPMATAA